MIPRDTDPEGGQQQIDAEAILKASDEDSIWEAYARELEDHGKHKRQTERAALAELEADLTTEGVKP